MSQHNHWHLTNQNTEITEAITVKKAKAKKKKEKNREDRCRCIQCAEFRWFHSISDARLDILRAPPDTLFLPVEIVFLESTNITDTPNISVSFCFAISKVFLSSTNMSNKRTFYLPRTIECPRFYGYSLDLVNDLLIQSSESAI